VLSALIVIGGGLYYNAKLHGALADVQQKRDEVRRFLYGSQINLAQAALRDGPVTRVLEILESQRPKDGEEDLRGFEWYYLWRLCHSERLTIDDDTGDHVRGVAFSPNAQRLVSANSSGVVKIWDAGTGREVRRFTWGGQGECIAMALSSNGQLVALGGIGLMTVCETATGRRLVYRDPTVERNSVNAIAFSPDSKRLALATNKDWVFILDAGT